MPGKRYTVYDVMEEKGVFRANPANAGAQTPDGEVLYKGPVAYPKMMYHPKGDTRVTVQAEMIVTPFGPQRVGEQREIIWQIAHSADEEKELRASGWHDHPAKAIAARGDTAVPSMGPETRINDLEAEIERLRAAQAEWERQKAEMADASAKAPPQGGGTLGRKHISVGA